MQNRALMPDYLRLFALFGIVVVNVQFMAFSIDGGFFAAPEISLADEIAIWLVGGLAYLKSYGLFSFMFGVGLAFQMRAAERDALNFGALYRNRMFGLIFLGVLHGVLFFPGDILVTYGLIGFLLFRWRNWTAARLARVGAVLLVVQVVIGSGLLWIAPEGDPDLAALEQAIMTSGSVVDVLGFRAVSFLLVLVLLLVFQGISALGWFCLGLAAVKAGLIDAPQHPLWRRARRLCLLPGVALSLVGAWIWVWGDARLGEVMISFSAPLATLGYLGLIAAVARPVQGVGAMVLKAGGASLTVYLGQSIVLSTVFAPFGLQLWGVVSPLQSILIALAVTLALIGFLIVWRRRFALGPFEWVLRAITRRGLRQNGVG
ncbi:MAG: DUF418 domain-containing protein [Pseudomonadota bacterium]